MIDVMPDKLNAKVASIPVFTKRSFKAASRLTVKLSLSTSASETCTVPAGTVQQLGLLSIVNVVRALLVAGAPTALRRNTEKPSKMGRKDILVSPTLRHTLAMRPRACDGWIVLSY